jgi:hypothetical protein
MSQCGREQAEPALASARVERLTGKKTHAMPPRRLSESGALTGEKKRWPGHWATKRAISASPAPPVTRVGLTESIETRRAARLASWDRSTPAALMVVTTAVGSARASESSFQRVC